MTMVALCLAAGNATETRPAGQGPCGQYGSHAQVAMSQTECVPECSGVAASQRFRDIYWVHGDSEEFGVRVWAFRLNAEDRKQGLARDMGYVTLTGAHNRNWEDMALGPNNMLYLFDGGDNPPCKREGKQIIRFAEPTVDPQGSPIAQTLAAQTIRFEYPDPEHPDQPAKNKNQRYDAECFLVHPQTGDMYVITKRDTRSTPVARIFVLPGSIQWNSNVVYLLRQVGDISDVVTSPRFPLTAITGGSIDHAGRRVVVRNYLKAYEFTVPPGKPFMDAFKHTPRSISLFGERQGEGICYAADGSGLLTTSEALFGKRFPIYFIPWRLTTSQPMP